MDAALKVMMGLESRSSHPYALAIVEHGEAEGMTPASIKGLSDIDGGVCGTHGSSTVAFVRPDKAVTMGAEIEERLLEAFDIARAEGYGASLLLKNNVAIALVRLFTTTRRFGCADHLTRQAKRQRRDPFG